MNLRVLAHVLPDYRVDPQKLDFGEIGQTKTQAAVRRIRIVPVALEEARPIAASTDNTCISARIVDSRDLSGSSKEVEVMLDFAGLAHSTHFEGLLIVETNSKRVPKVLVPVSARYKPPVEVIPESMTISSNERGNLKRNIVVRSAEPTRIVSVTCQDPRIRIEKHAPERIQREHNLCFELSENESIDSNIEVTVQTESESGRVDKMRVSIPVYRFSSRKEK